MFIQIVKLQIICTVKIISIFHFAQVVLRYNCEVKVLEFQIKENMQLTRSDFNHSRNCKIRLSLVQSLDKLDKTNHKPAKFKV